MLNSTWGSKIGRTQYRIRSHKLGYCGLSEVRRLGENTIKLKNGHIFFHKGNEQTQYGGVGFLIHKKLEKQIVKLEGISNRIAKLTLKLNKSYNVQII